MAASTQKPKPQYDLKDAPALFEKFIKDHNKSYKDESDKAAHFEDFSKNLQKINELNSKDGSATYDINKFADYTAEERSCMFGHKQIANKD